MRLTSDMADDQEGEQDFPDPDCGLHMKGPRRIEEEMVDEVGERKRNR